jgi:3-oxoacyl-[acyl-carrier protein] reductase
MNLGIRGKKAIVNGGSAGLGFAAAMTLAREGAELFLTGRGEERLVRARDKLISETGARPTIVVADHSTESGRSAILDACPEPDIFIGTSSPPRLVMDHATISEDELREAIEIGLISPFSFIQRIAAGMASRNFGRIVNIASSAVKFPLELRILSGAPRAALVNYTVAIAKKVARNNVTINTLLPALHLTEGTHSIFGPIAEKRGMAYQELIDEQVRALEVPAGRFGNPADFGDAVGWFCSAQAGYISGQSLVIDGGLNNTLI